MWTLIIGCFILGTLVLLIGLAKTAGAYPTCTRCKVPIPDGFDSYDDEGHYCRKCTRETGRRPWWTKDWMWKKMQEERKRDA